MLNHKNMYLILIKELFKKWFGKKPKTYSLMEFTDKIKAIAGERHFQVEVLCSPHAPTNYKGSLSGGVIFKGYIEGPGFFDGRDPSEVILKFKNYYNKPQSVNKVKDILI